jgi:hypothetical protein
MSEDCAWDSKGVQRTSMMMVAAISFDIRYCRYYFYYYCYLLQFSCHSMAVVLTLVETKQIRINIHKRNNIKGRVRTIQNTGSTSIHITKIPTHTHTHTLQIPHIHTPTHYKSHTYTHPHITKQLNP